MTTAAENVALKDSFAVHLEAYERILVGGLQDEAAKSQLEGWTWLYSGITLAPNMWKFREPNGFTKGERARYRIPVRYFKRDRVETSMTPASASVEHSFSLRGFLHAKNRNRLKHSTVKKLMNTLNAKFEQESCKDCRIGHDFDTKD